MGRIRGIVFETADCGRCGGTGRFGPMSVMAGTCARCNGGKVVLTRAGNAARTAYSDAMDDALLRCLEDITPGDRVWSTAVRDDNGRTARYRASWRTVSAIREEECTAWSVSPDGTRVPIVHYTIEFADREPGKHATLPGKGYAGASGIALRVHDDEAVQRILGDILKRFKGATESV